MKRSDEQVVGSRPTAIHHSELAWSEEGLCRLREWCESPAPFPRIRDQHRAQLNLPLPLAYSLLFPPLPFPPLPLPSLRLRGSGLEVKEAHVAVLVARDEEVVMDQKHVDAVGRAAGRTKERGRSDGPSFSQKDTSENKCHLGNRTACSGRTVFVDNRSKGSQGGISRLTAERWIQARARYPRDLI